MAVKLFNVHKRRVTAVRLESLTYGRRSGFRASPLKVLYAYALLFVNFCFH